MTKPNCGRAYAANLRDSIWDIVIPNRGKVSPLLLKARFESRDAADKWLASDEGTRLVGAIQESGRLPAGDTPMTPPTAVKSVAILDRIPELSAALQPASQTALPGQRGCPHLFRVPRTDPVLGAAAEPAGTSDRKRRAPDRFKWTRNQRIAVCLPASGTYARDFESSEP